MIQSTVRPIQHQECERKRSLRWKSGVIFLACAVVGVLIGALWRFGVSNTPVVFFNAHIMTMDAQNSNASAIGILAGEIHTVGSLPIVERQIQNARRLPAWVAALLPIKRVDLGGRTVLPGFIDAHSHFPLNAIATSGVQVSSPPFGPVADIPSLQAVIQKQAALHSPDEWIIGFNYDNAGLAEQRHPSRAELDEVAPEHPVYLRHRSGHMGVANTQALIALGRLPDDKVPGGGGVNGIDEVDPQLQLGLLQGEAAPSIQRLLREIAWWRLPSILFSARDEYLSAGVTTLQNGYADKASLQLLRYSKKLGLLPQRLLLWPAHDKFDKPLQLDTADTTADDRTRRLAETLGWPLDEREEIAIGAIKLVADGSPQGRTAWLLSPYKNDATLAPDFKGLAYMSTLALNRSVLAYHKAGFQMAIHGNGSAAIKAIIDALTRAQAQHPRADARHMVVHAQLVQADQLEALAELDVSVTFFPSHTYYWGDWYRARVLDASRAQKISPLASADASGVHYSIHADSPVTPMEPMMMLWSASERLTSSGYLLGGSERISRLRALRAMTIDAAWQNHLDHDRGSLEVGKLADFTVLSANPLDVDDVRDIAVQQVWIGGRLQFTLE